MTREKGWFVIPGVQDGDRTLEQQMRGVQKALRESKGRSVLDLGCAEGLISCEFAKAGASRVKGVDVLEENVAVARSMAEALPEGIARPEFVQEDLNATVESGDREQFDIVLALAVLHKLRHPRWAVKYVASVTGELAVIRTAGATPAYIQDWRSGFEYVDVVKLLRERGLYLEHVFEGPYKEWTGYFRRG